MRPILYDLIIVGASKEGIDLLTKYHELMPKAKIGLLSENLDQLKSVNTLANVDMELTRVVFSNYHKGITMLYTKNKLVICAINVVWATGTTHSTHKLYVNAPKAFLTVEAALSAKDTKQTNILVEGNDNETADAALKLADAYNHVYIVSKSIELECSKGRKTNLAKKNNVSILGSSVLADVHKSGKIVNATLNTYVNLEVAGIVAFTDREADISGINSAFYDKLDDFGHVSMIVPTNYAIGDLVEGYNAKIQETVLKALTKEAK